MYCQTTCTSQDRGSLLTGRWSCCYLFVPLSFVLLRCQRFLDRVQHVSGYVPTVYPTKLVFEEGKMELTCEKACIWAI